MQFAPQLYRDPSAYSGVGRLGDSALNRPSVTAEQAMAGGRVYAGNPDTVYRHIMNFYEGRRLWPSDHGEVRIIGVAPGSIMPGIITHQIAKFSAKSATGGSPRAEHGRHGHVVHLIRQPIHLEP